MIVKVILILVLIGLLWDKLFQLCDKRWEEIANNMRIESEQE